MAKNDDFLFGMPVEEVDEPLDNAPRVDDELEARKLDEKDKERKEKRYFSAFKLIIGCLIFLGLIYLIDTIVSIAFGKTSELTNSIIEIIKTLLFTLSGYLFARKENGD